MYKCEKCGITGEVPVIIYEKDGGSTRKCECCGSEELRLPAAKCDICGGVMFEGERAYEAGEMLICGRCVSEVLV